MNTKKLKKVLIKTVPYALVGLVCTNIGEAMRLSVGKDISEKTLSFFTDGLAAGFSNMMPSFHPFDLFIGAAVGGILWLVVYLKGKNAKKYRHNEEYGSARWGNEKDIEPFMDPNFKNNMILTQTERLTMNSRPSSPKYARNKNVLVVGGSGSGKTRFFIKPNLLQCESDPSVSFVCTDPKGTTSVR